MHPPLEYSPSNAFRLCVLLSTSSLQRPPWSGYITRALFYLSAITGELALRDKAEEVPDTEGDEVEAGDRGVGLRSRRSLRLRRNKN